MCERFMVILSIQVTKAMIYKSNTRKSNLNQGQHVRF